MMILRSLTVLALLGLFLTAPACCLSDAKRPEPGSPGFVLQELQQDPGRLPPLPPAMTDVAALDFRVGEDGVPSAGPPRQATRAQLAWARVEAERRTAPPDYWVFLTGSEGKKVGYWVPVENPRRFRVEHVTDPDEGTLEGRSVELGGDASTVVYLPLVPRAMVLSMDAHGDAQQTPVHLTTFEPDRAVTPRGGVP